MARDLYSGRSTSINYYGDATLDTEPDMRLEFENTLDGFFPEIAKGQPGLLRKMRRTASGALIECPCLDPITKEPDKDRWCPVCFGEGFYWDETNIEFYRVLGGPLAKNVSAGHLIDPGLLNVPLVVFYIRYNTAITQQDKIIELVLNLDGSKAEPNKRLTVYRISRLWDYRSDHGKLDYWKVFASKEDVKYLNAPGYEDV